jgi:DNA-binding response OmpR family regulator
MNTTTETPPKARLLVVDDEPIVCESCARIFDHQDYDVETTTDSHTGLARAMSRAYDAIVLDIKMPALDGVAFLERLRRASRRFPLGTPPVIAISGHSDKRAEAAARRLGIAGYLPKPFRPDELRNAVGDAVRKSRESGGPAAWARIQAATLAAAADLQAIERIRITNRRGERVTLIAVGILRRDAGPGRALVERLLAAGYPVEVSLGKRCDRFRAAIDEIPRCDRLLVLELRGRGLQPGSLERENAGQWADAGGAITGSVSLVVMQPAAESVSPTAFDPATTARIAGGLADLMA